METATDPPIGLTSGIERRRTSTQVSALNSVCDWQDAEAPQGPLVCMLVPEFTLILIIFMNAVHASKPTVRCEQGKVTEVQEFQLTDAFFWGVRHPLSFDYFIFYLLRTMKGGMTTRCCLALHEQKEVSSSAPLFPIVLVLISSKWHCSQSEKEIQRKKQTFQASSIPS